MEIVLAYIYRTIRSPGEVFSFREDYPFLVQWGLLTFTSLETGLSRGWLAILQGFALLGHSLSSEGALTWALRSPKREPGVPTCHSPWWALPSSFHK